MVTDEQNNDSKPCVDLESLKKRACEATMLLQYAIESPPASLAPGAIDTSVIEPIYEAVEVFHGRKALAPQDIVSTIVKFEEAYQKLSELLKPITAQSLADTDPRVCVRRPRLLLGLYRTYAANAFSITLIVWTLFFTITAIGGNVLFTLQTDDRVIVCDWFYEFLHQLVPFTYGGIGACLFLLKTLHTYIYARTFDDKRKPEYASRIVLGFVSGGVVVLLIDQVASDGGAIQISAAALGLLTGYNTDFLFSAIERVAAALLPKVGLDSVRRQSSVQSSVNVSAAATNDLINKITNAPDEATRKSLMALLKQLMG